MKNKRTIILGVPFRPDKLREIWNELMKKARIDPDYIKLTNKPYHIWKEEFQ